MERSLIESTIVSFSDSGETIKVMDGTNIMQPKGMVSEIIYGNVIYYMPYVGYIYKKDFPEIKESGEIKSEAIINKIKHFIK